MSLDEARSNFIVDASSSPALTSNYLLVGDNAYGYSFSGTAYNFSFIGDIDTYLILIDPGSTYNIIASTNTNFGIGATNANFALLDRYGNILALSTDYGVYSGLGFVATDSEYYIQTYTDTAGYYGLRLTNQTIVEVNGIGETIVRGVTYNAAIDYSSDVDIYLFSALGGQQYSFGLTSTIPDIYLDIEKDNLQVDSLVSNGPGIFTFSAPETGVYELHISSNSFRNTGNYSLITDLGPFPISSSPEGNSLDVPINATISFTLSESALLGTGNIYILDSTGQLVSAIPTTSQRINLVDSILTVDLNGILSPSESYALSSDAGFLRDIEGNDSPALGGYGLTTANSSYLTSANSGAVDEGGSVTFTVSTGNVLSGTSLSYILSGDGITAGDIAGEEIVGTITVDGNGRAEFTVNLAVDGFTEGPETLIATIMGTSASVTVNDTSTEDLEAPVVTTFFPSDEATDVGLDAVIVLTFNEPIQRGSGSIVLRASAGSIVKTYDAATSSNLSISGNSLTLNLAADLINDTAYSIEFATGSIRDLAGNHYVGTAGYNFTTIDAPMLSMQGAVYHWKSHMLLSGVEVVAVSSEPMNTNLAPAVLDLRAYDLSDDRATGNDIFTLEVWANAQAGDANFDFSVNTTGALSASFVSSLGASWFVEANTANPNALLISGITTSAAVAATGPVKLGTLSLTYGPTVERVDALISGVRIGLVNGPDLRLADAMDPTGVNGQWSITALPSGGYYADGWRNTADTGNAVTSSDALAALRLAVGLNPNADPDSAGPLSALRVSPYQFIAADVNRDSTVNSSDALAILRMAVKLSTALPNEWFFIDESRDFWNEAANSFTVTRTTAGWDPTIALNLTSDRTLNLVAGLKGDVNGSWTAPAGSIDLDTGNPNYFTNLATSLGMVIGSTPVTDQWGV
jgi:hypothetical protein